MKNRINRKRLLILLTSLLLLAVVPGFHSYATDITETVILPQPSKMELSYEACTYNGKVRTPVVTIYDANGNVIDKKYYELTYDPGRINVGRYYVKATFTSEYTGSLKKSFKIIPQKPTGVILSSKNNQISVTWDRVSRQVSGYQIVYSKSSTFAEGKRTYKKISGASNCTYHIKQLPVGATYYVKVRTYKNVGDKVFYSNWTTKKSIEVKQKSVSLNAKSAIIMEAGSKKVFFRKNSVQRRANASTTKIMTAILALESKDYTSRVKITQEAVNTPWSTLGSGVLGDFIYMRDLLHMALIQSDNGAATALAIHVSGSQSKFVDKMNRKASSLGLNNTHFKNPHGLDASGHYSSAKDLAILSDYCMKNSKFKGIVKKRTYSFSSVNRGIAYRVYTKNMLLGQIDGVIGLKTGTEVNAGNCFICAYTHDEKLYFTVVMGCSNDSSRWSDTRKLLSYIDSCL